MLLKDELGIPDQIIHQDFDKAHRIGPKTKTNHETVEKSDIVRQSTTIVSTSRHLQLAQSAWARRKYQRIVSLLSRL